VHNIDYNKLKERNLFSLNIAYRALKEDINLLCEGLVVIRDLLRYT